MNPGPVRIALLVVAALLAGCAGGWLVRGADVAETEPEPTRAQTAGA